MIQQQVLWLEVAVSNPHLMKILDGIGELQQELGGLQLAEFLMGDDVIKELPSSCVFHH